MLKSKVRSPLGCLVRGRRSSLSRHGGSLSPPTDRQEPRPPRIAAVVLAAGMSRRMGRPKALLPLGGLPLIVRVVEPILSLQVISPIVVVTGHHADQVKHAMDGCDVELVHNRDYEAGGMLS